MGVFVLGVDSEMFQGVGSIQGEMVGCGKQLRVRLDLNSVVKSRAHRG